MVERREIAAENVLNNCLRKKGDVGCPGNNPGIDKAASEDGEVGS